MSHDTHFDTLDRAIRSDADHALALRHAPRIRFDAREPFLPSVVGYTVFRESAPSPSFPREITLPPSAACAVEYAVWWDWEIQHLYELEHVWVYLDADEQVVAVDASWHGGYHPMLDDQGNPPLESGRAVVHSEPGKHAFAPSPAWLLERGRTTKASCGLRSGVMGVPRSERNEIGAPVVSDRCTSFQSSPEVFWTTAHACSKGCCPPSNTTR